MSFLSSCFHKKNNKIEPKTQVDVEKAVPQRVTSSIEVDDDTMMNGFENPNAKEDEEIMNDVEDDPVYGSACDKNYSFNHDFSLDWTAVHKAIDEEFHSEQRNEVVTEISEDNNHNKNNETPTVDDDVKTLLDVIHAGYKKSPSHPCVGERDPLTNYTTYKWMTYEQMIRQVNAFASGLLSIGLEMGQETRIAIFSANSIQVRSLLAIS